MNKLCLAVAIVLASVFPAHAAQALSEFTWRKRVVLVFGAAGDQRVARQLMLLQREAAALADRDIVLFDVSRPSANAVFGHSRPLDADRVRREMDVPQAGFQVVLVGKDGGVKLRSADVVRTDRLFELIDRMPMRRSERR